jgi:hypothetical protein
MHPQSFSSYPIRRRYRQVLHRLRDERDRLQQSCERFLRAGCADRAACIRFTQSVVRLSELHDQIYIVERALGLARTPMQVPAFA